jgi:hypothetical protein
LLKLRALEALRYREFRLLWYGQVFTSMATWMDSIARGWLIYELTNSSFQLGLVRGVQAIPTLLLSPIAGSAADLYSRKTQILIAQVVDGLLYTWVAVMIITGDIQPWHVYVTSLGLATVQAFQLPVEIGNDFRLRAGQLPDQRHGSQRSGFQFGAQRRPGVGGCADRLLRHGRILFGPGDFLPVGDRLDNHAPPRTTNFRRERRSYSARRVLRSQYHRGLEVQLEKL